MKELPPEFSVMYKKDGVPVFRAYLAGNWIEASDLQEVRSPIDQSPLAKVPRLGFDAISKALETMYVDGRFDIRDTPGEKRLEIYHKAADLLLKFKDSFIDVLVLNKGKTYPAAEGEVKAAVERLRVADLDVRKIYGEYVPGDWSTETLEAEAVIKREPLGIVLAITPFNYPLFDVVNKVVYSTVAGNAIMIKPASSTPVVALMFARILEMAGFPGKALSVITLPGSQMSKVVSDPRVSVVSLTGSTEAGIEVMRAGGIKQYIMELGGGDPAIVLSDADIKSAASKIVTGMTSYAGQRCDSIKFIFAESQVYDELKKGILDELGKIRVGDPRESGVSMGPLIDEETAKEVVAATQDAVEKGGKVLHGGTRKGNYIEPTLIEVDKDKLPTLYLYKKEVFASIAAITPISNIDEAIKLSNGRSYGLDAAIFGEDISKIRKLMRLLEVGAIYINDYPKHGIGYFPFGGRKDSGVGREGVGYTIESVTAYKTIVYNYKGKGIWEYM